MEIKDQPKITAKETLLSKRLRSTGQIGNGIFFVHLFFYYKLIITDVNIVQDLDFCHLESVKE
jgi:hypothetical protein